MQGFCPLASGSRGNCLYFGTAKTKILIDAGISGKLIEERLTALGVALNEIQAILITHEHGDHIQGLRTLAYKRGIPVFANHETAKGIVAAFQEKPTFKIFSTGEPFVFGDLEIHPFSIPHDTLDPVAFTIRTSQLKVGICTDLGFVTSLVRMQLRECDYLCVEANHQPSMVHACNRPLTYKQRVLSRSGHLSNEACGQLLIDVASDRLKHVHLAHLSSECNSPQTALQVINNLLAAQHMTIPLSIAPQERSAQSIYF